MIHGVEAEVNENHIDPPFVKFGYDSEMLTWFGEISRPFPLYRGINKLTMRALSRAASIGMFPQQVRESFPMKERWIRIDSMNSESHMLDLTGWCVRHIKACKKVKPA